MRGGEEETVSSRCLSALMQAGGGFKVLTTGLLRVELAPEEYQLYSEGCGWDEEDRDQHGARHHTNGITVNCCGMTMQK